MPQVPVYNVPQTAPQELPGVRQQTPYRLMQSAEIGPKQMQGLGNAVAEAGTEGLREATLTQIQQNEAAAKEHDANLMGSIQGILYGTKEQPDSGFINQKGKNAVDAYDTTVEKLNQLATSQSQTLTNGAQQQMVKTPTQLRIQSAIAQASQHRAQQADVYQTAAGQTRIKVAQDGAARSFNPVNDDPTPNFNNDDPGANSQYQQYLQTIRSEANDLATRKGLTDPDVRDAFIKDQMGKAYVGTLAQMLDGRNTTPANMAVARKYFDAVKDDLSAEQQDKIRSVLDAGDNKTQALQLALEMKDFAGNIGAQEAELDDRFKAGKISAEVHGMATQLLRADNAQRRQEQSENDKSVLGNAWDLARNGKTLADMSPGQIAYIKTRGLGPAVDSIFKKGGDDTLDDAKAYNDLMRMSADDPSGFTKMDLSTMAGQLSKAHWNHLVGVQTSISRQDVKAMDQNKLVHNAIRDAKNSLLNAGFNLNPKPNTSEAAKLNDFETDLRDALTAAQEAKEGKPLTQQEARDIVLGRLKDQALAGTGYFGTAIGQTHKPVWQMTPEERAKTWVIPDGERAQIKASLQRAGMPATEDNIQMVYKRKQGVR